MEKLRVLSLFSGCGAFEKSLENLGIQHEVVGYCEIDKYAAKAYSVLHGVPESMNYGDITKINVDELPEFDMVTYGFPCQDISVAGKQAGINEGTRSGLVSYPLKFIAARKPKYAICENVKNLVGKKFKADFDGILADLSSMGYTNHWKVLNSKDYGVPQNRARVFIVSIRNDVTNANTFVFPEPYDNGVRLRDVLEPVVDEKYYIDDAKCAKLLEELQGKASDNPRIAGWVDRDDRFFAYRGDAKRSTVQEHVYLKPDGVSNALTNAHVPKVAIPCLTPDRLVKRQNGRRFKEDGDASFTVNCQDKHGVLVNENKVQQIGNIVDTGNFENQQRGRIYSMDGISPSLNTCGGGGNAEDKTGLYLVPQWRIRKLTPLECFRLQAFDDSDHAALVNAGISNSQMYRITGNSITVTVLMDIFKALLCANVLQSDKEDI